jgi:hypothetical protein
MMYRYLLFLFLISLSSQGQYLKLSTIASSGISKGAYASQVIGQSSVATGTNKQVRQGFKQPLGANTPKASITSMLSVGEPVNWSVETFPNPFVDQLTVKLNKPTNLPTRLMLYDIDANLIWEGVYDEKHTEMSLNQFKDIKPGKYILQVFKRRHSLKHCNSYENEHQQTFIHPHELNQFEHFCAKQKDAELPSGYSRSQGNRHSGCKHHGTTLKQGECLSTF